MWTKWTNVFSMQTVNVHEAKTNFSRLLTNVEEKSETIVICRSGVPVADLVPHQRRSRIKPGLKSATIQPNRFLMPTGQSPTDDLGHVRSALVGHWFKET
jgi:antitoxin (DNA-binding transcriptional repressor) of toxin-antitoxin stability system